MARTTLLIIATWLLLATLGCGTAGPFDYVPVHGQIVFDDGTPLGTGRIVFEPLVEPVGDAYPRAGSADLKPDGSFDSVTSYKPGDGLVPGDHKVAIMYAVDEAGNELVPEQYANMATTPLTINTADAPFTITIPKP